MTHALLVGALFFGAADFRLDDANLRVNDLLVGTPAQLEEAARLLDRMGGEADRLGDDDWKLIVRWKKAKCRWQLGKPDEAARALEEVLGDAPQEWGFRVLMEADLGEMYLASCRVKEARGHIARALTLANGPPGRVKGLAIPIQEDGLLRLKLLNASCLTALGENGAALKEIAVIDNDLDKLPRGEGWALLAVEIRSQLAELDRRNSETAHAIGRLRWCLEELRPDESARSLQKQFQMHILLANIYRETARFLDALKELEDADRVLGDKSRRNVRDLAAARANIRVDEVALLLDRQLESRAVLKKLALAETVARQAMDASLEVDGEKSVNTGQVHYLLAQVFGYRGRVFDATGRAGEAGAEYDRAKVECDAAREGLGAGFPDNHDLVLHVRRFRAWVNLQRNEVEAARKEGEEALAAFRAKNGKDHVDCGLFHGLLLEVEEKAGDAEAAADHAEAHRRLMSGRLAYLAGLTAPEQIRFFQEYDEPALHGGLRLGVRWDSLGDRSAEWLLNGKAKIAEVMARVYQRQQGRKDSAAFDRTIRRQAYALYGPKSDFSSSLVEQLEAEKRELVEKEAQDPGADRWIPLTELRGKLAPDQVYIDVYRLRPRLNDAEAYYAWVVADRGPAHVIKLGDAAQIDPLVNALQEHLERCGNPATTPFYTMEIRADEADLRKTCLRPLSDLVLANLMKDGLVKTKTRWVVSPDGALWNVPWAALPLPGTDRYAVEQLTIRYVVSGRDLLRAPAGDVKVGPPWIVADPDFERRTDGASRPRGNGDHLPPLVRLGGARREGADVAACLEPIFHGARLLTGREATREEFLKLHSPAVVYLATHSFTVSAAELQQDDRLPVDPMLCCGLALAGSNYLSDDKKGEKEALPGLLTGAEVLAADLRGTEVVVLSSCQSGTGAAPYGQSPADLRHAFHMAGARAVVSTLWSVDDEPTHDLMVSFMKNAYPKGGAAADKAEALAAAQRAMIEDRRKRVDHDSHPFFWAAFTVSGS